MRALLLPLCILTAGMTYGFPVFQEGCYLYCSGDTLVAAYNASPAVFDWDGDGTVDLLTACCEESGSDKVGTIRFYRNTGTNQNPVFTGFTYLQADGEDIHALGHC